MFRNIRLACIAAGGIFVWNAHAVAATITFDSIPASWNGTIASVTDAGFTVASQHSFWISDGASFCSPQCPENGTHYLITQAEFGDGPLIVSATNGSTFGLTSFQYAETWVGVSYSPHVYVVGHLASGGTIAASFLLDGINDGSGPLIDFQTAILPTGFQNLTSVDFTADYTYQMSLDNLAVTPIPVPASLMLLISGIGVLSLV